MPPPPSNLQVETHKNSEDSDNSEDGGCETANDDTATLISENTPVLRGSPLSPTGWLAPPTFAVPNDGWDSEAEDDNAALQLALLWQRLTAAKLWPGVWRLAPGPESLPAPSKPLPVPTLGGLVGGSAPHGDPGDPPRRPPDFPEMLPPS